MFLYVTSLTIQFVKSEFCFEFHFIIFKKFSQKMILILFVLVLETSQTAGDDIVSKAKSKLGCEYVYGASGPDKFDCSGFTQWVHKQFGISIPRTAALQEKGGSESSGEPGDIVCFGSPAYHVGIYIGNDECIHAPQTGDVVKITKIKYFKSSYKFRRYY